MRKKNSPLPWKIETRNSTEAFASNEITIRSPRSTAGDWVADMGRRYDERAVANADLIVEAVNSHHNIRVKNDWKTVPAVQRSIRFFIYNDVTVGFYGKRMTKARWGKLISTIARVVVSRIF